MVDSDPEVSTAFQPTFILQCTHTEILLVNVHDKPPTITSPREEMTNAKRLI